MCFPTVSDCVPVARTLVDLMHDLSCASTRAQEYPVHFQSQCSLHSECKSSCRCCHAPELKKRPNGVDDWRLERHVKFQTLFATSFLFREISSLNSSWTSWSGAKKRHAAVCVATTLVARNGVRPCGWLVTCSSPRSCCSARD